MTLALAQKAAELWGISPATVTLAAHRENMVFKATKNNKHYALRLHRPGYRTKAELESELNWMQAITQSGLAAPMPIASRNGTFVEVISRVQVDLLTWLPGAPLGAQGEMPLVRDRVAIVEQLGRLLADLHRTSDDWGTPDHFQRPRWDLNGLVGDTPLSGPSWDNPDLVPKDTEKLILLQGLARTRLASLSSNLDFGLIHADAITENIMLHNDTLALIDFDDGGWGFRDFELATFLMRFLPASDFEDIKAALLRGYQIRRNVDSATLDFFILLRALTYLGWIIPRRNEPGGVERSLRAVAVAMPLVDAFLEKGY